MKGGWAKPRMMFVGGWSCYLRGDMWGDMAGHGYFRGCGVVENVLRCIICLGCLFFFFEFLASLLYLHYSQVTWPAFSPHTK